MTRQVATEWQPGDLLVTHGGRVAHGAKYAYDEPGRYVTLCGQFLWKPARRQDQRVCGKCVDAATIEDWGRS